MKRGERAKVLVAVLALVCLAAACGARVTDEQRLAATNGTTAAGTGTGATGVGAGTGTEAGPAGPGASEVGGDAGALPAGGEAGATAENQAPGAAAPAPGGAPAPQGDNGGATDVGVTADTISLGTVTTLSGPIPGLFQGAAIGSQAVVAYLNSQGGINGRKLKLTVRDDQFDAGQHRAQTQDLVRQVFAFLGSFSTFDDAGTPEIEKNGVPDLGYGLTDGRRNSPINFSPQPAKARTFRTGGFLYYGKKFPEAVKAVGTIYGDVPASKESALDANAAAESVGWKIVYERGYQPTESDFTADVVRMRQAGVKAFFTTSADAKTMARILKAMQQQGFKPEFIALGASAYDATFPTLAGAAAEGVFIDQQLALYQGEDASAVPEVALMNQWMQKVKPGYKPDLFAAFAWASGRMLEQALKDAGPQLTRQGLLAALKKIDNFDANGLLAPSGPASKRQATCDMFMQVKGGKFVRLEPAGRGFLCGGSIFTRR